MMKFLTIAFLLLSCTQGFAQNDLKTENVFLITVDGLRWQELYGGADSLLIGHEEYVNNQPGFVGRVAAFASWDVFPYIINSRRSGMPVNAVSTPYPVRMQQSASNY